MLSRLADSAISNSRAFMTILRTEGEFFRLFNASFDKAKLAAELV